MNNDLISREALKKALKSNCDLCHDKNTNWCEHCCPLKDFEDLIDNAPTVDITEEQAIDKLHKTGWLPMHDKEMTERPQGEWITRHKLNSFGQDVVCFECNKCGEYKVPLYHLLITEPLKVCPNCGANMRKGGAE